VVGGDIGGVGVGCVLGLGGVLFVEVLARRGCCIVFVWFLGCCLSRLLWGLFGVFGCLFDYVLFDHDYTQQWITHPT